jgi:predicted outer membrane repeat protein
MTFFRRRFLSSILAASTSAANTQIGIPFPQSWWVGPEANCDFHTIENAIGHVNAGDTIYIVPTLNYVGHLAFGKSLRLAGAPACNQVPPPVTSTQTFATLDGDDNVSAPVINYGGSGSLIIEGLEITGGDAGNFLHGGAIDYRPTGGSLTLNNVVIDNNDATDGGGISISPTNGGSATLNVGDYVQIINNRASDSGGGIYVVGESQLNVMGKSDFIALNHAGVTGGGIRVTSPAHAALGSPGLSGLLIYANRAQYGGGISAYADDEDVTTNGEQEIVSLFTTDPQSPGQIYGNIASIAGGAIYLKPQQNDVYADSAICAQDFVINQNFAPEGAAFNIDADGSCDGPGFCFIVQVHARGYFNSKQCRSAADNHAMHCAPGVACNQMSGNAAMDVGGHPTDGAIVFLDQSGTTTGEVDADRLIIQQNQGGYLFHSNSDGGATFKISEMLTGGNILNHEMFRMEGEDNEIDLELSTLAPDIINATHVITLDNADENTKFTLSGSIIDEPGTLTFSYPGDISANNPNLEMSWLLSNDITTLLSGVNIRKGDPMFVDAANADPNKRDYHLTAYSQNGQVTASPAIDASPGTSGLDISFNVYGQNVPLVTDFGGPHDLGVYEMQPIVRLFADGFGDRISLVQ